jgi:Tol biopolymer transport system component
VGDGHDGDDCHGLGTAVAATIGGATYGVAKSATLYSVRAFNCFNGTTITNLVAAIDWVTGNHVSPAVAHVSISTSANATIDTAVSNSIASGVSYALAAGDINVDAGTRSPSRVAAAMTVGGTNTIDGRVSTSNFGAVLDLFAPGQDIPTAFISDDTATTTRTGTAMAAAHVAGEAARYLQANPTAAPSEVSLAITSNATPNKVLNPGTGSPNLLLYKANGKIAFVSYRDGNPEIYSMNVDGTNQTRLTNSTGYDSNPVWSPDGSKIAFESNRNGNIEIFVMNSNGTNPTNLTNDALSDYAPSWSPDGTKIAFVRETYGYLDISVMNSDGSNQIHLSDTGDRTRISNQAPSWSPDGTKIAFSRGVPREVIDIGSSFARPPDQEFGNSEIFVINSDGTNLNRLTYSDEVDEYLPVWSPNGAKIAFQTNTPNDLRAGYDQLYVMNADGGEVVGLTASMFEQEATFSDWSPDNTRVAFDNSRSYTVKVDNTNPITLTSNTVAGSGIRPIFLLDGSRLLFTTQRNGNQDIYVMNADGSNQTALTTNPGDDFGAAIQPL